MDITGLELTEGYKLTKKFIPDPVVLQPVRGGFLLVTVWGDEASDELVVNNKFN
jgi:ABC-type molybdate transport system permease subunit